MENFLMKVMSANFRVRLLREFLMSHELPADVTFGQVETGNCFLVYQNGKQILSLAASIEYTDVFEIMDNYFESNRFYSQEEVREELLRVCGKDEKKEKINESKRRRERKKARKAERKAVLSS